MTYQTKPFGIGSNLNYLKESIRISWRTFLEYKANSYTSLFFEIIFSIVKISFLILIQQNFGNEIGWNLADFLLFYILIDIIGFISILLYPNDLSNLIKSGNLNLFISKPLNIFFKHITTNFYSGHFIFMISHLIQFLIIIVYFNQYYNFSILFILVFLLVIIFEFIILHFIASLNFIIFDLEKLFLPYYKIRWEILPSFPFQFFGKSSFKFLLFGFGFTFVGSLLVPLVTSKNIWNFNLQIEILIGLIIILSLLTYFNWKYGLKKYEAFG